MRITVFWDVMSCDMVQIYEFSEKCVVLAITFEDRVVLIPLFVRDLI